MMQTAATIDDRAFRKTLGCFATGVTVVTARDAAGAPIGVTVNSFSSVSLTPPLVLFSLGLETNALKAYVEGPVAINVLREDQRDLSIRFAASDPDRFAGLDHDVWDYDVPILRNCIANLECEVGQTHTAGDHVILICEVKRLYHAPAGQPLVYFRSAYVALQGS